VQEPISVQKLIRITTTVWVDNKLFRNTTVEGHDSFVSGVGMGCVCKVEEFEAANVESLRLGRDADKIACVVDPAGYYWEVLERHVRNVSEALCKVLPHHQSTQHSQVLISGLTQESKGGQANTNQTKHCHILVGVAQMLYLVVQQV